MNFPPVAFEAYYLGWKNARKVKVLKPSSAADKDLPVPFTREARLARQYRCRAGHSTFFLAKNVRRIRSAIV